MMIKQIKNIALLMSLLFGGTSVLFAQIGGNPNPLYTSVHKYQIEMGETGNYFSWRVYDGHVSVSQIENGAVGPLSSEGRYTINETDIDENGYAYVNIKFDGNPDQMPYAGHNGSNGYYTLAYTEVTDGDFDCEQTEVYQFILYPPIDVDIEYLSEGENECPDSTGVPQYDASSQSTRTYNVTLEYPGDPTGYAGSWYFNFKVDITGQDGENATVAAVRVDGATVDDDIQLGTYSFDHLVEGQGTHTIQVDVVYNDVLDVPQSIILELSYITGSFNERDEDVIHKTEGNIVEHAIFAMPNVGNIVSLN